MKSPDEIKKGLECCSAPNQCYKKCAYACLEYPECIEKMTADALALIQQLQEKNEAMHEEIVRLQAERNAAIADIRLAFTSYVGTCQTCKHGENQADCIEPLRCGNCENEKCKCQSCDSYDSNWEWRGVQKEVTTNEAL